MSVSRSLITGLLISAGAAPAMLSAQEEIRVPSRDRMISPAAEEVYRVGSLVGEEWETFADVRSVAFDGAGNLYILDADNHRVVVVDPHGRFLRQFGKEGEGPGELRAPFGMVVAADGSVAIQDMGHQAFVVYDRDGNFVRNARNDFQNGLMGSSIHYHPRHGAVGATTARVMTSLGNGGASPPPSGAPVRFVPFGEDQEIEELATAYRRPPETSGGGGGQMSLGGDGGAVRISGMPILRAFEPGIHTGVLPDGRVVLADSADYRLKLVAPTGGVNGQVTRDITPARVTRRDQEAERERRREEIENQSSGSGMMIVARSSGGASGGTTQTMGGDAMKDMMLGRLETMEFAEVRPVIAELAVDMEGRIWVERSGRRVGEDGATDVITADGEYLGTIASDGIRIPDAFGPDGLMAYIARDEYDVEYVVVRRIPEVR